MFKLLFSVVAGVVGLCLILAVLLPTFGFYKNKKSEVTAWEAAKPEKIDNLGSVSKLKVLPLVDYYTNNPDLAGEAGSAYLIEAGNKTILFDVGYNPKNEHPSPLLRNMDKLNIEVAQIDNIVISHNHIDHIGGLKAQKNNTFYLSGEDPDLQGIRAFVPEEMSHLTAETEVTKKPRKIAEGIATTGTIDRALWLMGLTAEQALAINVEGKGLVLIVGCGHQRIERIIRRTKDIFDIPIYGVIGGLHLPVEASRMKFNFQRILGTGKLPWQRIGEDDVDETIEELGKLNLGRIGLSAHDSCDWSLHRFKDVFKEKYLDVIVGREIIIEGVKP